MAPFGLMSVGNVLVRTLGLFSSTATVRCSSIAPVLKHFSTSIVGRPKQPLNAYTQYVKAQQDDMKRKYPGTKQTDIFKKIAQQWKMLMPEEKRPFEEAFAKSQEQYKADLKKYMEQLTPAQAAAVKEEKRKKVAKRKSIRQKRELTSLGKPKHCRRSFSIFMSEHFEEMKGNTVKERFRNLSDAWRNLDASEKQVYVQLAEDDKVRYKNEMSAWEEHMIDLGKGHLIRKLVQKKSAGKKDRTEKPLEKTSKATAKKSTAKGKAVRPLAERN